MCFTPNERRETEHRLTPDALNPNRRIAETRLFVSVRPSCLHASLWVREGVPKCNRHRATMKLMTCCALQQRPLQSPPMCGSSNITPHRSQSPPFNCCIFIMRKRTDPAQDRLYGCLPRSVATKRSFKRLPGGARSACGALTVFETAPRLCGRPLLGQHICRRSVLVGQFGRSSRYPKHGYLIISLRAVGMSSHRVALAAASECLVVAPTLLHLLWQPSLSALVLDVFVVRAPTRHRPAPSCLTSKNSRLLGAAFNKQVKRANLGGNACY